MFKILGVGDFGASNTPGDIVKTFALGSCVAVIMLHAKTKCVGMVHVALPDSSIDTTNKAQTKPGYFADTGIPSLIKLMQSMGCKGPGRNGGLTVKIAGGANVMACNDTFQIGKR
ncbi:MAG: chemotaxis protein CheD, partial [Deltaproteobacteria bacterium]|nr:chemotaxis protein CheD [Deltaproteobacteria bacterium]